MNKKMDKIKKFLFVITICLAGVASMSDMALIPAANGLYSTFQNEKLVNFIMSGPALICVAASLLCGKLMERFEKKKLIVVSFILFSAAAVGGILIENVYYILLMRCLVGLTMGVIGTTILALITDIFEEENERSMIVGIYNAAMGGMGALLSLIAGKLAVISWKYSYGAYWITVPIIFMTIFFLPKTPREKEEVHEEKKGSKFSEWIPLLWCGAAFFLFSVLFGIGYYQIGIYIAENNIGNENLSGLISSLGALGSLIGSLFFGIIYKRLKRNTVLPTYILFAVSYLILYFFRTPAATCAARVILGLAYGIGLSYYFTRFSIVASKEQIGFAMGMSNASNGLGLFCSTFATTMIKGIFSSNQFSAVLPLLIVLCMAGSIASLLCGIRDKKIVQVKL